MLLSARREGEEIVISVKDNGSGIAPEMLPRVFELFVQGQRRRRPLRGRPRPRPALVRSLVEMHGGTVVAKSDGPGRGSEFVMRLPLPPRRRRRSRCCERRPRAGAATSRRVLVVDDNVDAAEMLGQVLGASGHEVMVVYDPAAA